MAIVVSHLTDDFESLARQALRQVPLSDLVELRLDRIGHPGEERLRDLIARLKKPVIVAVPGPEAHGTFAGSIDERFEILHAAARAGAMFVDVDYRLSLDLGEVEGKCHRMVSRHELEGTPEDLAAMDEEVRAVLYEGDAVKLVCHANSSEDGLRMLRHLRSARGGLVAFCSGDKGSFTRILAPIFGSPFTYAAPAEMPELGVTRATAPGQLRVNELRGAWPPGGPTPRTAVFAVVGNPIGHSLSPFVHGMSLKGARLDAVYVALEPTDFAAFLELADDENFRGFSITAPFKQAAFAAAHVQDEPSQAARAANTLVRDAQSWRAHNTDVPAIRDTLERGWKLHLQKQSAPRLAQEGLGGAHVLVLGCGGAARAIVCAVRAMNARATLAGRDLAKARAVASELGCDATDWQAVPRSEHDVLIHATPVGSSSHSGHPMPIPEDWIRPNTLVLDCVYRPVKTALLAAAMKKGCTAVPGAEWFVRQAADQFKLFTHQDARDDLMRAAFENALRQGAPK
jgi:3-dehydroquinate dehydratase/shikimate dehydrogenase